MEVHAKARAKERYDLDLTDAELRRLADACANVDSTVRFLFAGRVDSHRWTMAVTIAGQWYPVIFDTRQRCVVTFLPYDVITRYAPHLFTPPPVVGDRVWRGERYPSHPREAL